MRLLALAAAALIAGCFSPDEREGAVVCGAGGACPPGFQCHPPDQRCYRDPPDPGVDASPTESDGMPPPDADPDEAGDFCTKYEDRCGFSSGSTRYDDRDDCLTSFQSYDDDRKACVKHELNLVPGTTGSARNAHCTRAAGNGICE